MQSFVCVKCNADATVDRVGCWRSSGNKNGGAFEAITMSRGQCVIQIVLWFRARRSEKEQERERKLKAGKVGPEARIERAAICEVGT